ncbi:hypothetical protein EW145_g1179 [Phellinidium pouzarii]|uniref:INO80 complex subunit B-like conserved region domain-containing protein n=1 Tax=Phellinidium pouzarii TaxID=167371 RepID=A0A4V3XDQ6_9AGAM|nr:hypothetical protein EW145_g1179 [Phellinidium pouzarii]
MPRKIRQPPPEPVIEVMEVDGSGEDMDVSEDEVVVEDGASSEAGKVETASEEESNGEDHEDHEDEIDVEDEQDPLGDEEDDEEDQEDELSSSPSRSPPPRPAKAKSTPTKPRLKIRLKFSGVAPSNATPTPSDEMPLRPGRKGHPRNVVVESEDEDDDATSSRSTSYAGPTRMTHRQAALAGMVESAEHIVLEETVSKKKKNLNETELALKREETARKRKNLSVKKLEDEKTETINRLLKKQSRSRGKKTVITEPDEEAEQDAEDTFVIGPAPVVPTLFRWISTNKSDSLALSFSVPPSLLPDCDDLQNCTLAAGPFEPKSPPLCDVNGCTQPRKYKLVKDSSRGGCGMDHLKALQVS